MCCITEPIALQNAGQLVTFHFTITPHIANHMTRLTTNNLFSLKQIFLVGFHLVLFVKISSRMQKTPNEWKCKLLSGKCPAPTLCNSQDKHLISIYHLAVKLTFWKLWLYLCYFVKILKIHWPIVLKCSFIRIVEQWSLLSHTLKKKFGILKKCNIC